MGSTLSRSFLLGLALALLAAPARVWADPFEDYTSADINAIGGSASANADGSWTVVGGGSDIWLRADEFQYLYRTLDGDGSVTVRILSQTTNSNPWAKAGVMLRDNDSPGAPHLMLVMTPGNGVDMQWRSEPNGDSRNVGANSYPRRLPLYLRVQREGNRFTGFVSEDGATWIRIGSSQRIAMGRSILAGICVTAHNANALCTARFDRVGVNEDLVPTGPGTVQALVRNAAALVVWDSVSRARSYHVYRRGPGDATFNRVTRQPVNGLSYTDTGLTNGAVYRYQVTAVVEGRESVPSDEVTVTPAAPIQGSFYSYAIGTATVGSAVQEADGSITVRGSGWDIWYRQDGFQYLAAPLDGDAVVTVRVLASPTQTDQWAKAGIMLRESLAPDSRHAMLVVTPKNGVAFQWRRLTGGESDNQNGQMPRYPMYLRLVRNGDWITPYLSLDGLVYEAAGPAVQFNLLNREIYVGLAVTAHRDRAVCVARFDQLTITGQ